MVSMMLTVVVLAMVQGENRFIESMCQTIMSVDELLWVINHPDVDSNLKKPFMRYFLWVYMKTAGSAVESGAGDLPHDQSVSHSLFLRLSLCVCVYVCGVGDVCSPRKTESKVLLKAHEPTGRRASCITLSLPAQNLPTSLTNLSHHIDSLPASGLTPRIS